MREPLKNGISKVMKKISALILTILFVFAVILFGLYAMGILDGDGIIHTDSAEFQSGGFTFTGEMKDGLFEGDGTIVFNDGGVFTGAFSDGRFSGDGTFYNNGGADTSDWYYNGVFQNGRTDGGVFHSSGGTEIFFGRGSAGADIAAPKWQYNGEFNEHGQNGTGSFTFEDGSVYNGSFLNGLANGEGEYSDAEGKTIYKGSFSNGAFNGQGVYFSPEGWSYEGSFKNGLFDGDGTYTDENSIVHGIWKEGAQVGVRSEEFVFGSRRRAQR